MRTVSIVQHILHFARKEMSGLRGFIDSRVIRFNAPVARTESRGLRTG